jgi:CubicO group peptidase (beta-lactamase class C family)
MQYSLSMHRIVLSLLFTAGLGSAEPARIQTTNTGLSEERLKRVSAGMQRYIDQGQVAGTVSLISRRGQIAFLDAQGHMDREAKTPMRTDSIFRLASMTKPIASVALMMLFEEGRFLLNDPVSKYLPEFKDMKVLVVNTPGTATPTRLVPAEQEITIRHLLSHTAGLAARPSNWRIS